MEDIFQLYRFYVLYRKDYIVDYIVLTRMDLITEVVAYK